jgi:2-polyprenyl-3-methyl-5-hydroxy-6-metoxy-1,4-benzoquinol methylase
MTRTKKDPQKTREGSRQPLSVTPLFGTAHYRLHHDRHSSHRQIAGLVSEIGRAPILDVGAAFGFLGYLLRDSGYAIDAIEPNPVWAKEASQHYRKVFACAVEEAPLDDEHYGTVVCADVLEHTANPAAILRQLRKKTTAGARVIVSVPNVAHLAARIVVALGKFPRMERGIFDRTHLQFFTRDTLRSMLADAGLEVESIRSTPVPLSQALSWPPQSMALRGLMAAQWPVVRLWPTMFSYQWIIVAHWASGQNGQSEKGAD